MAPRPFKPKFNSRDPYPQPKETILHNKALLKERRIQSQRPVIRKWFDKLNIVQTFLEMECERILFPNDLIFPECVKEFYSSLRFDSRSIITTTLFGEIFSWTLEEFFYELHFPCVGPKIFTLSQNLQDIPELDIPLVIQTICKPNTPLNLTSLELKHLLPECLIIQNILAHNLFMKYENLDKCLAIEAYVIFCLQTRTPCNIGFIMIQLMVNIPQRESYPMPFGTALSAIFQDYPIPPTPYYYDMTFGITRETIESELLLISRSLKL